MYTAIANQHHLYVDDITITAYVEGEYGEWQTLSNAESLQTINNLTPETSYQVRVKGICDGTTFPPTCWEIGEPITVNNYAYNWKKSTSYHHTGAGSAYSDYYGPIYLMMPDIQISSEVDGAQLSFWSYNTYVSSYDKNSVVLLNGENETELWSPESVSQSWVETTIDLSNYVGQTISLASRPLRHRRQRQ